MGERLDRKIERLLELKQLLLNHRLTKADIARRLGVHRSTAAEYLDDLSVQGVPVQEEEGYFFIDRDLYKVKVEFTQHESLALHLAARLLTTSTDKHNPHAASALRKLGEATQGFAPLFSEHLQRSADVMDDNARRRDAIFLQALETLTRAWTLGRKVSLTHQLEDGKELPYIFAPYFIEPYAPGRAVHVIGRREPPGEIRTFKVERIRTIKLLDEAYTIPSNYDPREQLKDAWGIWYTERPPQRVALRFSRQVAGRVRETQWHHSERTRLDEQDGSLIWEAEIAEWQEMLYWVRGWGADVEVLEPKGLKSALVAESRRLASMYGVLEQKSMEKHWLLWAKTNKKDKKGKQYHPLQYHPLLCHLIDVGQVARLIWREVFTSTTRVRLSSAFSLTEEETERLIAFICAAHDIGKASPSFQQQNEAGKARLIAEKFIFASNLDNCRHEAISYLVLADSDYQALLSRAPTVWSREVAEYIAGILSGHHGRWRVNPTLKSDQIGNGQWDEVRAELYAEVCRIFRPPKVTAIRQDDAIATLVVLSGLVTVADWIGSREDCFQFASSASGEVNLTIDCYVRLSEELARKALQVLDWLDWQPPESPMPFETQFAVEQLRPMQARVVELASKQTAQADSLSQPEPTIVIIEDATGSGKTEAALYLADHWSALLGHRGAYIGMPTMATSNGMFDRYNTVLQRRYTSRPNLQLAHGQAAYRDNDIVDLHEVSESDKDDTAKAENWFAPRKRTLLATFGVGTVDQALMSVLQTKHFFVRLLALANKTVIFDEVHAYDAHMSTIFQLALTWLHALGSSVVILSATLPLNTRQNLLRAYLGQDATNAIERGYPSVVWASANALPEVIELQQKPEDRIVQLAYVGREPAYIMSELKNALEKGGCAVIICNRVQRAQELYRALERLLEDDFHKGWIKHEDLMLFHARFPMDNRKKIEDAVLKKFGKPIDENGKNSPDRPLRAILIATQVVEQSLDLDFDVMISDLAPIDLLIQRAGRLWRHRRMSRPVTDLILRVMLPEQDGEVPDFGKDAFVYKPYTLLRSWLELRRQSAKILKLPSQTRDLIEAVYGSEDKMPDASAFSVIQQTALNKFWNELQADDSDSEYQAEQQLIPSPFVSVERIFNFAIEEREEDDPTVVKYWRARTRDILPSVSLICLHYTAQGLSIDPEERQLLSLGEFKEPDRTAIRALMGRVVTVTHPRVVDYFLDVSKWPAKQEDYIAPPAWKKRGLLRYCRVAVFKNSTYKLGSTNVELRLTESLGLEIVPLK
jgi:CRISPR-associated endonuclease/helicase Cas3